MHRQITRRVEPLLRNDAHDDTQHHRVGDWHRAFATDARRHRTAQFWGEIRSIWKLPVYKQPKEIDGLAQTHPNPPHPNQLNQLFLINMSSEPK